MTRFIARSTGTFAGPDIDARCALGKGGTIAAADKREGDGASPLGVWPMRRLFFRSDRLDAPETGLECVAIAPDDGWCDDPKHPFYNKLIKRPFAASHEKMWRDDHVYDLVVELGYNDDPIAPGRGSAIFLHLAKDNYSPTEGCVALEMTDLLAVLRLCSPGSSVEVTD